MQSKTPNLTITVEQVKKKKSEEANNYCWKLCTEIAKVIRTTKEKVYLDAVKHAGVWETVLVKEEAVNRWSEVWKIQGTGWPVEVVDNSRIEGFKEVHAYYGSSTYNSTEMWHLTNYIIDLAKELEIETRPPDEVERMVNMCDQATKIHT